MSTETRIKCDACGAYYRQIGSARAINRIRLEASSEGWRSKDPSRDYCQDCVTAGKHTKAKSSAR